MKIKKQRKQGISLIVLVITIIVMIILAAAIIISLSNNGIIGKANEAVEKMDLAQVRTIATTIWANGYLEGDNEVTIKNNIIKAIGEDVASRYDIDVTKQGVYVELNVGNNNDSGSSGDDDIQTVRIIPENASYIVAKTKETLTAGMNFPQNTEYADQYVYGDYTYTALKDGFATLEEARESAKIAFEIEMGMSLEEALTQFDLTEAEFWEIAGLTEEQFVPNDLPYYWNVAVIDKTKSSYGEILSSINGINVESMNGTFSECNALTDASHIIIPNTITSMYEAFKSCENLTKLPELPDNLLNLNGTFYGCDSLTDITGLVIPSTVTQMDSTFEHCQALTDVSGLVIPVGIINMNETFNKCIKIEVAPDISKCTYLIGMRGTYSNCEKLKTYVGSTDPDWDFSNYVIPESVTDMGADDDWAYGGTFANCSITKAPAIPKNVTNMHSTFAGCYSLEVAPDLSNCTKLTDMSGTFSQCRSLKTYTGSTDPDGDFSNYVIPESVMDMGMAIFDYDSGIFTDCYLLEKAPTIPENVADMQCAFYYCKKLTGTIVIDANPTEYDECFNSTTLPITISGTCSAETKSKLAATASNKNVTY